MKNYVLKVIQDLDEEIKSLDKEMSEKYVDLFLIGARSIHSDIDYAAIQDDVKELSKGLIQQSRVLIQLLNEGDLLMDYRCRVYIVLNKTDVNDLRLFDVFNNQTINVDYDFFLEVERIVDNPLV